MLTIFWNPIMPNKANLNETSLISTMIKFYSEPVTRECENATTPGSNLTTPKQLEQWITQSSTEILKNIEETNSQFWKINNLSEPSTPLGVLCPEETTDIATSVLLLMIWSRWNKDCSKSIIECLRWGAEEWSFDKCPVEDYLLIYIHTIKSHVWYSVKHLQDSKVDKSDIVLEALCLSQAICNTSDLFCILREDSPRRVLSIFLAYLKGRTFKTKVHVPPEKVNGSEQTVTFVSIFEWYQDEIFIPRMKKVLKWAPLSKLSAAIDSILKENKSPNGPDSVARLLEKPAGEALSSLGMDHGHSGDENDEKRMQVLAFVILAKLMITKKYISKGRAVNYMQRVQKAGLFDKTMTLKHKNLNQLLKKDFLPLRLTTTLIEQGLLLSRDGWEAFAEESSSNRPAEIKKSVLAKKVRGHGKPVLRKKVANAETAEKAGKNPKKELMKKKEGRVKEKSSKRTRVV